MVNKTLLFLFLIGCFLACSGYCLAQETGFSFSRYLNKVGLDKVTELWLKYLEPYLDKHLEAIKANVKQGIEEERGELSSGLKDFVSKIWNFFWNFTKKNVPH